MGIDACMFVRTKSDLSEKQIRRLAGELHAAFQGQCLWVATVDPDRHCLNAVEEYTQDGPSIQREPGEQLIEVALDTRYYGPGYERGNAPVIIAIAEWLERRVPGASIWYGGDSSGVLAEPFGSSRRAELMDHFCAHGHEPYQNLDPQQTCGFCGGLSMAACRFGFGGTGFRCGGCGLMRLVKDGNATESRGDKWPDQVGT